MKSVIVLILLVLISACAPATAVPADDGQEKEVELPTPSESSVEVEMETSTPSIVRADLPDLGAAPELENQVWINTDGPLRLNDLRGQVVLVDMWTFG